MDGKRRRLRVVALFAMLLLLVGTFLSFFIAPRFVDARTRETLGLPEDAFVTDTARSPWVYINETGAITLYGDKMLSMTTLRVPRAVNGIEVLTLSTVTSGNPYIETVIIPSGVAPKAFAKWHLRSFTSLKTVVFEEGTEDLTGCSLVSSEALERVYLPKSIKTVIGFLKKDAPVTVYYAGTEEEWMALGDAAKKLADRYTVVFDTPFSEQ